MSRKLKSQLVFSLLKYKLKILVYRGIKHEILSYSDSMRVTFTLGEVVFSKLGSSRDRCENFREDVAFFHFLVKRKERLHRVGKNRIFLPRVDLKNLLPSR